jgi:tetraacyldisaccharide 4'-kinase
LQDWRTTSDLPLFCTEKDAVKLWAQQPQAWAVPLVCELPATLLDSIDQDLQKLSSRHGQKTA